MVITIILLDQTIHTQKKRDCTVAVPLLEAFALPITLNKQHRSPRRYVRIHARPISACDYLRIHIPRTSKCCNVLELWLKVAKFQVAKHRALMTPLLCLQLPHPKDIIPRRGLITGAKVQYFFELSK